MFIEKKFITAIDKMDTLKVIDYLIIAIVALLMVKLFEIVHETFAFLSINFFFLVLDYWELICIMYKLNV